MDCRVTWTVARAERARRLAPPLRRAAPGIAPAPTRTIRRSAPSVSNPAARRAASARSSGAPPTGSGRTCGSRPSVANSVITSSSRRSNAAGSGRPARGDDPVPERLGVVRIVEQPAIAEVPQLPRRRLLRARLVEHEPPGELRVQDPIADHGRTIRGSVGRRAIVAPAGPTDRPAPRSTQMRPITRALGTFSAAALLLAACGGGAATTAPTAAAGTTAPDGTSARRSPTEAAKLCDDVTQARARHRRRGVGRGLHLERTRRGEGRPGHHLEEQRQRAARRPDGRRGLQDERQHRRRGRRGASSSTRPARSRSSASCTRA